MAVNVKEFIAPSIGSPDPFGEYVGLKFSTENWTMTSEVGWAGKTTVKNGPGIIGYLLSVS